MCLFLEMVGEDNVLDYGILVSEFEIHLRFNSHVWINILGKHNDAPPILPSHWLVVQLVFFYKNAFGIT